MSVEPGGSAARRSSTGKVEARGEAEDRGVARVDQLAAELADLAVGPIAAAVAVHAPADAGRGLVDRGGEALVLQGQRRGEAGDAGTDDRDPRLPAAASGREEAQGRRQRPGGQRPP